MSDIRLRDTEADDLPLFFEQQQDAEAVYMAAFTAKDPADWGAFLAHWTQILGDPAIVTKTILLDGLVAGHVTSFQEDGRSEVSYWLGKQFWGRGLATRALAEFLRQFGTRPLYARAAKDNLGSLRVLEKCGFTIIGEDTGFANARSAAIEEYILELRTDAARLDRR